MLFNKAIAILAVASIKQGMSASAEEEKRLRGMNTITISSSNDGGVNKYVATNHSILPMDQVSGYRYYYTSYNLLIKTYHS